MGVHQWSLGVSHWPSGVSEGLWGSIGVFGGLQRSLGLVSGLWGSLQGPGGSIDGRWWSIVCLWGSPKTLGGPLLGCGVCRGFWGSVSSQCGSPVTVWGLQTDLGSHRWGSLGVHSRPSGLHRCSLGVSRGFWLTQVSLVVTCCHLLTPHPSLLPPGTPGGFGGGGWPW